MKRLELMALSEGVNEVEYFSIGWKQLNIIIMPHTTVPLGDIYFFMLA